MYFDHAQAAYENKCKEKYEELKEKLRKSKDENDEMIWKHIMTLEYQAEQSKKKLNSYQEFFTMLQQLLPRQSSIHDVIR
jgi:predicted nuclease with TOPRIM domain